MIDVTIVIERAILNGLAIGTVVFAVLALIGELSSLFDNEHGRFTRICFGMMLVSALGFELSLYAFYGVFIP